MFKQNKYVTIAICMSLALFLGFASYGTYALYGGQSVSKLLENIITGGNTVNNSSSTINNGTVNDGTVNNALPAKNLVKFKSFAEFLAVLKTKSANNTYYATDGIRNDMAATQEKSIGTPATDGADHSSTNTQVQGIDEGDVLKTDGKYIYAVSKSNTISIIDAAQADKMSIISKIEWAENENISEIYIKDNKLIALGQKYEYSQSSTGIEPDMGKATGMMPARDMYMPQKDTALIRIYDISNTASPTVYREAEFEGGLLTSRIKGGSLYLIINKWLYFTNKDIVQPTDILPTYSDSAADIKDKMINAQDIAICPLNNNNNIMTAAVIGINDKNPAKVETVYGSGNIVYMSDNSLYITYPEYRPTNDVKPLPEIAQDTAGEGKAVPPTENAVGGNTGAGAPDAGNTGSQTQVEPSAKPSDAITSTATSSGETTIILKFKVNSDSLTYQCSGEVKGNILNQFSMDEYNDNFRIATTDFSGGNNVYVLSKDLKISGKIEGLAKGERIYSVRFSGKTGYVVTYKNMDPLFVIDLSNPGEPKVAGELKIPGFSNYLHPVGEGRLLGIGVDTSEDGAVRGGLKLSLFDVSNPNTPKEISTLVIGKGGTYSDVQNNHKALTYNAVNGTAYFPISIYEGNSGAVYKYSASDGAVAVTVANDKITLKGKIIPEYIVNGGYYNQNRLCYIGANLYFFFKGSLISYNADSLNQLGIINTTK